MFLNGAYAMAQCVLLNADYTFLNLVNWKRTICLMAKGKVEVVKDSRRTIRNCSGTELKVPAVMRLIKLIRTIYRTRVTFTKRNVLIREKGPSFVHPDNPPLENKRSCGTLDAMVHMKRRATLSPTSGIDRDAFSTSPKDLLPCHRRRMAPLSSLLFYNSVIVIE